MIYLMDNDLTKLKQLITQYSHLGLYIVKVFFMSTLVCDIFLPQMGWLTYYWTPTQGFFKI